jgi:hypothetical protein
MEMIVLYNNRKGRRCRRKCWKFTKLPEFLNKCCADMKNADKTSLFYCAALVAPLSWKCAAVSGSKRAVDCAILLCSSNMSESNKWKLMDFGERTKH